MHEVNNIIDEANYITIEAIMILLNSWIKYSTIGLCKKALIFKYKCL